ncbi:YfiR family protein [candidate division KSB1 bacterium]|nr:YfiR family protein [candidate division KSB1 bacterium]
MSLTQDQQIEEYKLKAIFFQKFALFVDWPESSSVNDTVTPFILGIYGKNLFGDELIKLYHSQPIKNKTVEIRYLKNVNEITGCHLLYISRINQYDLNRILDLTRDKPILTISDTEGFAKRGVIINFYLNEKKLGFEINQAAALKAGLNINFRLLRLARIVAY